MSLLRRLAVLALVFGCVAALSLPAEASTEQAKQVAIDKGLAWLASTQSTSGSEGYWSYTNDGTLAATGAAALAFLGEGYLPGTDVIIDTGSGAVNYGDVVGRACNYIFNRATSINIGAQTMGHPEDYDNNGSGDGNGKGIYFNPGNNTRNCYTTGIVAPVVFELGQALGQSTQVGRGTVATMTYQQVLRDVVDWYSWGQVDPAAGVYRGGWHYDANYSSADNSTAQWGAITMLYGQAWGLNTPQFVKNELGFWTTYIQHGMDGTWKAGGSGYMNPNEYVNMSKTAGLLLELAAMGVPVGDARVQNALAYMQSMVAFDHWNQSLTSWPDQWDGGNFGNPYAMWAAYKALETYGIDSISTAPGGFTIGQEWDPELSLPGDWFAQYCDYLVSVQNANGSWSGADYWTGSLASAWYINILNASGAPPPIIPEPVTVVGLVLGIGGLVRYVRRRM